MTEAKKTLEALNVIKSKVGTSVGSGECYGLVALYSELLGGCNIGGGINTPNPNGSGRQANGSDQRRGMSASNIGGDYAWASYGWQVLYDPSFSDLKTGVIINWKPTASNIWGHTGVVSNVSSGSFDVIDQNYDYGRYTMERTGLERTDNIESIIYPPELVSGDVVGTVTGETSGTVTGNGSVNTSAFDVEALLIEVDGFFNFQPNEYEVPNLLLLAYESIQENLRNYKKNPLLDVEFQLLNSEFTEIELYDIYGNSYAYQPQFFPKDLDPDHKYKIITTGSLGDNNQVHINFLKYNNSNSQNYVKEDIYSLVSFDKWAQNNPEHFKYGLNDVTGKNVAILNDAEASYIQTHKNQMEHTQLTFKENKEMLKQNIDLSTSKVNLANDQSTYNAKYALDTANINQWSTGIGATADVVGKALSGDIGGAVSNVFTGGLSTYNAMREYQNRQVQAGFVESSNKLNSQSNALANMQAKIGLDQSIRAYNSTLADLQNQPISVQQIGNDLSFQTGNNLTDIFWKISLAQKEILSRANDYIKCYGVLVNIFSNNALEVMTNRKKFNYLKMITVNLTTLQANQSHMNSLSAIFQSGVRIWNYEHNKDDSVLFDLMKNNPNF
jgi:hypothetical protein